MWCCYPARPELQSATHMFHVKQAGDREGLRITENKRLEIAAPAISRRIITRSAVRVLSPLPATARRSRESADMMAVIWWFVLPREGAGCWRGSLSLTDWWRSSQTGCQRSNPSAPATRGQLELPPPHHRETQTWSMLGTHSAKTLAPSHCHSAGRSEPNNSSFDFILTVNVQIWVEDCGCTRDQMKEIGCIYSSMWRVFQKTPDTCNVVWGSGKKRLLHFGHDDN